MSSAYYQLTPHQEQYILEMNIGKALKVNLKPGQAERFLVATLSSNVRGYAKRRMRAFEHYKNSLFQRRSEAFHELMYKMGNTAKWDLKTLSRVLLKQEDNLLILLPNAESRHYKNDSQFVFDLINFCHEQRDL